MSMYDDGDKDFLYEEIIYFLNSHYTSELLEVVTDAIRNKVEA